jgi:hypothetical protein
MQVFYTSAIISFIYSLCKFLEMRFILKENKPLKIIFRDTLLVYVSVVAGTFIVTELNNTPLLAKSPEVFTNAPNF